MAHEVPEAFVRLVDEVAREALGSADARGAALARHVARLSEIYTRAREGIGALPAEQGLLAARLRFQLPRDLPKVGGPLGELGAVWALPGGGRWRVLDLGAGLGAACLGAALYAAQTGAAEAIDVRAIDRDPAALRILRILAERARVGGLAPVTIETTVGDFTSPHALPPGPFDLVLFGLALNELGGDDAALEGAVSLLRRVARTLSEGGSIVVIEPALRATARFLHRLRDRLVQDGAPPLPFAPCLRSGPCPMLATPRDWCHEELPLPLPKALREVAKAAGLRRERLTYSYLTLRNDGRSLREIGGPGMGPGESGEMYRIVSAPLPSKGKLELFACGIPGRPRLMRLHRHRTEANASMDDLGRGRVVWLDPPGAPSGERLRVGAETHVRTLL